jgi:hypothetical protein
MKSSHPGREVMQSQDHLQAALRREMRLMRLLGSWR